MLSFLLAAALGGFSSTPELAGVDHWTLSGLPGGQISSIAVDPSSGTVYVLLDFHGVRGPLLFKTADSGRNWTALAGQPDSSNPYSFAVDSRQAGHLLAVNGSGIAMSIDGGSTWSQVVQSTEIIVQVSFDPSTPGLAYYASISLSQPCWRIFCVYDPHLYRSVDGGASWVALEPPIAAGDVVTSFSVAKDGTIFVVSGLNLLKSSNNGASWSSGVYPAYAANVTALVPDPVSAEVIYALTSQRLFRSSDGGNTWSRLGNGVATYLAIDPADPATLYAGGNAIPNPQRNGGIWKSTDTGVTWKVLPAPFPPLTNVTSMAIGPGDLTVWAGTFGDGIFRSPDGGESWTEIVGHLPGSEITAIAVDRATPGTIYAGADNGYNSLSARLYGSSDAGQRWRLLLTEPGDPDFPGYVPEITSLAVDPVSSRTVFATVTNCVPFQSSCGGDVYKTTDGGLSWSALGLNAPMKTIAVNPAEPQTLYASSSDQFSSFKGSGFKSNDGGATWTVLDGGFPTRYVTQWVLDPSIPATVYVATCAAGVFASTDGGATWEARNLGLSNSCVRSLARDPVTSGTLYAGTDIYADGQPDIFKSTDGGMSWMPTGFFDVATSLVFDPVDSMTLFAGTIRSRVFQSLDGGASWASLNDGLGNLNVTGLAIDSEGRYLHAATLTGVYDLRLRRLTRVVEFR